MILHRQSGWRYSPRAARCQLDVSLYSESVAAMHRLLQILKRPAVATAGVALVLLVAVSTAVVAASHRRSDVGAAPAVSGRALSIALCRGRRDVRGGVREAQWALDRC
jgi:hypothetical protein